MQVYCPHCAFGPQDVPSGTSATCPVCNEEFSVPEFRPQPMRLDRFKQRKRRILPVLLDTGSAVISTGGGLLTWHAFTAQDAFLLECGKVLVVVGLVVFIIGRFFSYFD